MKLLMFTSETCAGCHQMEQYLPSVCEKAKVSLMIADVCKRTDLAIKYHVGTLPTLVLLDNGKPVKQLTGMLTEKRFVSWLQKGRNNVIYGQR